MRRQLMRKDDDWVFRAAERHSRLVRFLRYVIPAGIVAIASIISIATFLNPFHLIAAFPIDPGRISLSGTKITMELPRVNGFTSDSRPYQLTAHTAAHDIAKPDILELNEIEARIDLKDGQHVTVTSINGVYYTKREMLKLNDRIVLKTTSGYEAHLSEATIDVASSNVVSDTPVEVKLPNDGLLNANRLDVGENGDFIVFGGGVEMTLNPDQLRPVPQDGPPPVDSTAVSAQHPPVQAPAPHGRDHSGTGGTKRRLM